MKNATDITILLDRSGSMGGKEKEVINGFNEMLNEQQKDKSEAYISLFQFDTQYTKYDEPGTKTHRQVSIQDVPKLKLGDYTPRGMTALNDAIGMTIDSIGQRLAALPENERPNKVVLYIFTDGAENASKEYTLSRINEMIKHQEDKYNWQINFIGSTLEAQKQVDSYASASYGKMALNEACSIVDSFKGVSRSLNKTRSSSDGAALKARLENDAKNGVDTYK